MRSGGDGVIAVAVVMVSYIVVVVVMVSYE